MAYDRSDWHDADDLPEGSGGTHIGMFLAWAFSRGMAGDFHREESDADLKRLARREITGREFLIEACDEKLWEDDLNDEGNALAADYYDHKSAFAQQHGTYLTDYDAVFSQVANERGEALDSLYLVEDTWENFDRLSPLLDQRLEQWRTWSAASANRLSDPKLLFQDACQQIGACLTPHGFKPNKAGTQWKKTAADKDTVFEVSFERGRYNTRSDVRMEVHVRVASRALKKWIAEQSGLIDRDTIAQGALRRPFKDAPPIAWQLAGSQGKASVQEISRQLEQQVLPWFDTYSDCAAALARLADRDDDTPGIRETDPMVTPLAYVLCFGTREQAQHLLDRYVATRAPGWRKNILKTFEELAAAPDRDPGASSYVGELDMRLAFKHGVVPTRAA